MPDAVAERAAEAAGMSIDLLAPLGVLALIDSTSFGTLLIPIWFMLTPRLRPARIFVFLGTVAGFYFLVGLLLVAGFGTFLGNLDGFLENPVVTRVQLVVGVALVVWSFFIGRKKPDGDGDAPREGRLLRWRMRAMGEGAGMRSLVGLALAAALVEVASMLPYLAATGLIGSAEVSWPQRVLLLAGYCLVMVLPALVLLALRLVAHRLVAPMLGRIAAWMERTAGEWTAWIVGIVGFLVARDAFARVPEILSVLGALDSL